MSMDWSCPYQGDLLAGVDEVGRGPLFGDVVTAAVILDSNNPIDGLADSKRLTDKRRDALFDEIKAKVKQYIADNKLKKGEWVEGGKWGQDYKTFNAMMLDEVSANNPVFLLLTGLAIARASG